MKNPTFNYLYLKPFYLYLKSFQLLLRKLLTCTKLYGPKLFNVYKQFMERYFTRNITQNFIAFILCEVYPFYHANAYFLMNHQLVMKSIFFTFPLEKNLILIINDQTYDIHSLMPKHHGYF